MSYEMIALAALAVFIAVIYSAIERYFSLLRTQSNCLDLIAQELREIRHSMNKPIELPKEWSQQAPHMMPPGAYEVDSNGQFFPAGGKNKLPIMKS